MSRQITSYNTVTNVVPETGGMNLAPALNQAIEFGSKIAEQANEAKLLEVSSAAQLELSKLNTDYKIKNETDPFNEKAYADYKSARQSLLNKYGSQVSPMVQRQWNMMQTKLSSQSDMENQAWQYKQAAINTKVSIEQGMQNYLNQASIDGEAFGSSAETAIGSFANYQQAQAELSGFGSKYLGEATTSKLLDSMSQDWAKSFISGVAKNNPVKALKMLDQEVVQNAITDRKDFNTFRDAIEARAMRFQDIAVKNEILGTLSSENSLFNSTEPLTYAQLRQATHGMSEPAQDYFLSVNGYKAPGDVKLTNEEKFTEGRKIFEAIFSLGKDEKVDLDKMIAAQSMIYEGMNRQSISRESGSMLINQLLSPAIQKMQDNKDLSASDYNPFNDDYGLEQVKNYVDNNVITKIDEEEMKGQGLSKENIDKLRSVNAQNAFRYYSAFMDALSSEASKVRSPKFPNGMTIPDIKDSDLTSEQKRSLYSRAQAATIGVEIEARQVGRQMVSRIPPEAIRALIKNPETASAFDSYFGEGRANMVLGK